jgi:putative sporulation protein YtxC
MELLSIGSTAPMNGLKDRLARDIDFLSDEGLVLRANEGDHSAIKTLSLWLDASIESSFTLSDLRSLTRQYAVNAIADHMVEDVERVLVQRLVEEDFGYFSPDEQQKIVRISTDLLTGDGLYPSSRKTKIREQLSQFVKRQRHINIEGFLRFRLQDYYAELKDAVIRAVDEFLVEKEYSEFIRLLRYFVEIQDPKIPLIHVRVTRDGTCDLYDQGEKSLHHEYLDSFEPEDGSEVSYEDLLISALITLAPEVIVLHVPETGAKAKIAETITSIFEDRVTSCVQCELCLPGKLNNAKPVPVPRF